MGSRMPDSPVISRMDGTLHPFLQKNIEKSKNNIPSIVYKTNGCFQKNTKTKVPQWQDLSIPILVLQFCIDKGINIEGLGKNGGSIMHPYF